MSKYIEDVQGKIVSNPINETNTNYPFIQRDESGNNEPKESHIDYQYMYNHNEPVSDIDTAYYDDYRNKVEKLRKRTESTYEALESCLVPVEIPGMSFQPYDIEESEDDDGNKVEEKMKSFSYFFQDHLSPISVDSKEFVFRTNKVKFIDDRHRRLIYDRTIHIMSLKEDEDKKVSFKDVIRRIFFEYWNNNYCSRVRNKDAIILSYDNIVNNILNDIKKRKESYTVIIDDDGNTKQVDSVDDFDYVLQSGQDIDTLIPSTVYNLHNIGWIHPSMIFLNGLAIDWTKIIISVDNIDTFIIVSNMYGESSKYIDDDKEIFLDYIHIPFKVVYIVGQTQVNYTTTPESKYLNSNNKFDNVIFVIDKTYACIVPFDKNQHSGMTVTRSYIDRVVCVDPNIKFAEFYVNNNDVKDKYLPDAGIQYTRSFKEFCDNDYRCKLKRFNFIGFEVGRYDEEFGQYHPGDLLTLKNDDFDVTWHPFNIMDIRFKRLYNNRRLFKVFYNTKVLYDQDNILRIKNHDKLADEYEQYRKDVTANIETYMNEIYILVKKDIGTYIASNGLMKGYKYHFVTPYECFMIYNAILSIMGEEYVSFDDFRNINVSLVNRYIEDIDTNSILNYLNGGFIVFDDEHNYFSELVKETTLYKNNVLNQDIKDFFKSLLDKGCLLTDILMPIDNEKRTDTKNASNAFYAYQGDNRGKIIPFTKLKNKHGLIQEYDDLEYDYLKLRFELSYLNNMEEGATPVDEFIYYFDNENLNQLNKYPIVSSYTDRYTANVLNAIANNIFQYDPHYVLKEIIKMNYQADYIIPKNLAGIKREDCIVYIKPDAQYISNEYQKDPKYFYNYGFYEDDDINKPKKLQSEWGLRRSLPEMFYWSLDENEYTMPDSMHLLDEVFNFTYGFDKSYEENLKAGTNYIIGYDADKLEQSIKRSVVSITRTGKQLKDYLNIHPSEKDYTLDGYKSIIFVKNKNYKIVFDNIRIIVGISKTGEVSVSYTDTEYNNPQSFTNAEMKHVSQEHTTIIKNGMTFKDVDKNFTQAYYRYDFDKENGIINYYDASGDLVIKLQADKVIDYHRLQMSRWNISNQDNYVMIFKNRELYSEYHSIEYNDIAFSVEFDSGSTKNDDMFEFVFFLNANNTVMKKYCETEDDLVLKVPNAYWSKSDNAIRLDKNNNEMDKGLYEELTSTHIFDCGIACNTDLIDAENVQLLVNTMPKSDNDEWEVDSIDNTTYELSHKMYSYQASTYNKSDSQRFVLSLCEDKKVNGLHRVTKQGGGEYFLEFDGHVPKKDESISGGGSSGSTPVNPSTTGTGIGLLAFSTVNINNVKFAGTIEEWNKVSKTNPWLNSRTNLNNLGGVQCTDGKVLINENESQYD